jgi:hypothetical protein
MEPREFIIKVAKPIKESVFLKGFKVSFATRCRWYRCCATERQAGADTSTKRSQEEHLA